MADYALLGWKYGASTTAGTAGGKLTWSLDSTVPAFFAPVLTAAFNDWSSYANIQFAQTSATASATIVFSLSTMDGLGKILGEGGSSYYIGKGGLNSAESGSVTFDKGENWHVSGSQVVSDQGVNLFPVAVHEIGHVLGLDHYNASPAIMNAYLTANTKDLTSSDIHGIQYLYGAALTPTASATNTTPAPAPTTVSTKAAMSTGLVDAQYYLAANPDVAASGMDPAAHYASSGWKEGRNPDAFFSTNGYLAANPDVAKAGVNPLDHYDQSGWKEGRDPSAAFDNEQYVAHNPDVKATGMDPLLHYLKYGQVEGRATYAAIGKPSDFTHGSFDSEYYLLANPDVAKAALASGGDSFAFAFQHYQSSGWKEGRKADAFFDSAYYLAHNPDVAAAGMNPLAHYDQFGWKEGRDPSAAFDTSAYLAANPDVAAAHIDPLLHYLQYGANEGRHLA